MSFLKVVVDFETQSLVDLPNQGLMRYSQDESTRILMMGYKVENGPVQVWLPGQPLPVFVQEPQNYEIYAWNAEFELAIWNGPPGQRVGFTPLPLDNTHCIAALAARYGLPYSLEACASIKAPHAPKNPEGKLLIKHFSCPPFPDKYAGDPRWERFIQYCADDVKAEYEIWQALPASRLNKSELWLWRLTVQMNQRGIPIDYESVSDILFVCMAYRESMYELLPELTNGVITKITQTKRIVQYCQGRGIDIDNCTAETVGDTLLRGDLPDDVLQLLEMRAAIGLSSIGKYVRMKEMSYGGRVHYNQRYCGAATGRFTGTGVQLLNLPRAKVDEPESVIASFKDGSILYTDGLNPIKAARGLIRPCISTCRPTGSDVRLLDGTESGERLTPDNVLVVADYTAIEYVLLEWFASNDRALKRFLIGADQYTDQAAAMYKVDYDDVTDEQRRAGKIVVLGCGYGQGANKLVITAKTQWGLRLTEEEANFMVQGYRREHRLAVSMWYKLHDTIVQAIQNPGVELAAHKCKFKVVRDGKRMPWLTIRLPSGRVLYYAEPWLEAGLRGLTICHKGYSQVIKKWGTQYLIPGRITENIVQATARDILVHALRQLVNDGYNPIWSVYDEIICEEKNGTARENEQRLSGLCERMGRVPEWAAGLPLRTKGYWSYRYRKG